MRLDRLKDNVFQVLRDDQGLVPGAGEGSSRGARVREETRAVCYQNPSSRQRMAREKEIRQTYTVSFSVIILI